MFIHLDPEADFLEVRFGKATPAYYENLGNDIFERIDRKTKKITGYAIFNIKKRNLQKIKDIEVELPAVLNYA